MVRLHIGVVLGAPSSSSCWAAVEIQELAPDEPTGPWGRLAFVAGPYESVKSDPVVMQDRLLTLVKNTWASDPLVWIETASASGYALHKSLRNSVLWPAGLAKPHRFGFSGKDRQYLLAPILQAKLEGRFELEAPVETGRSEILKAIESHQSEVGDDGRLSGDSEADAALTALGLAMWRPLVSHLQPPTYRNRDGSLAYSRMTSGDPYVAGEPRR